MSIIKSFSVGEGDMFYIEHNSDNFTIIDCYLDDDNKEEIIDDIQLAAVNKGIRRFISTHPDEDHIAGLKDLDNELQLLNFYCVKNSVTKDDETRDFKYYCELRDSEKAFYIKKDCARRWMNLEGEGRGTSGISILWPDIKNDDFKFSLLEAELGGSPNNISPIIRYHLQDGVIALWMGDLETDFMESIEKEIELPKIDVLFAPHHGRDSGKLPESWLEKLDPKLIIIGEAPSADLNYYDGYNTITQNTAGNITFECITNKVHIFVSNTDYSVDFLDVEYGFMEYEDNYLGTLNL